MDESLTHFLESPPGDIPYHIQVNLSQDIAQALAFLHANGIIHRDLSSNNVLLIAGSRAKVSDFGMSKFADISKTQLATMTQCPGTPAFMSPEALNEPPVYTEKLDTFSLGVLLVQVITCKFPDPADRFKMMRFPNPQNPSNTIEALVLIPETERRQLHIALIDQAYPLLPIALECLRDKPVELPSSQQLCQSLDALKKMVKYQQSQSHNTTQLSKTSNQQVQEQVRSKDQQLQTYRSDLNTKEAEIKQLEMKLEHARQELEARDRENRQLRDSLKEVQQEKQQEVFALNENLMRLNQQLQLNLELSTQKDREIAQQKETIKKLGNASNPFSASDEILDPFSRIGFQDELQQLYSQATPSHNTLQSQATPTGNQPHDLATPTSKKSGNMSWCTHPDSPTAITAGSSTEIGSKIYFVSNSVSGADLKTPVYEYNSSNSLWRELPPHSHTSLL